MTLCVKYASKSIKIYLICLKQSVINKPLQSQKNLWKIFTWCMVKEKMNNFLKEFREDISYQWLLSNLWYFWEKISKKFQNYKKEKCIIHQWGEKKTSKKIRQIILMSIHNKIMKMIESPALVTQDVQFNSKLQRHKRETLKIEELLQLNWQKDKR